MKEIGSTRKNRNITGLKCSSLSDKRSILIENGAYLLSLVTGRNKFSSKMGPQMLTHLPEGLTTLEMRLLHRKQIGGGQCLSDEGTVHLRLLGTQAQN